MACYIHTCRNGRLRIVSNEYAECESTKSRSLSLFLFFRFSCFSFLYTRSNCTVIEWSCEVYALGASRGVLTGHAQANARAPRRLTWRAGRGPFAAEDGAVTRRPKTTLPLFFLTLSYSSLPTPPSTLRISTLLSSYDSLIFQSAQVFALHKPRFVKIIRRFTFLSFFSLSSSNRITDCRKGINELKKELKVYLSCNYTRCLEIHESIKVLEQESCREIK